MAVAVALVSAVTILAAIPFARTPLRPVWAGRVYGLLAASVVLVMLLNENDKLYARLVAAHERTRALHRTREEQGERRMAVIVDTSDDAIVGADAGGLVISWNGAAERLLGYRPDDIVGRPAALLVPSDHRQEDEELRQRVRSGSCVDHLATTRRRSDGRLIDVILSVAPLRGPDGAVFGATTVVRDVSERIETPEALIMVANRQVETMFGYPSHELVGQPMELLPREGLQPPHREPGRIRYGTARAFHGLRLGPRRPPAGRRRVPRGDQPELHPYADRRARDGVHH